ncbi:MAG: N-acetyltransferase [Deltaproteobacteria bacterium]|nr:N-acetyltransferase [Deltaproteobacteria bacterium]
MPFIHPTAVVDENVKIGEETRVWHFVHICSDAKIGKKCVLGQNVFIDRGVQLGDGIRVQNNVSIYSGVKVEDDVFLGPSCVFTNVINPRAFIQRKNEFKPTLICRGATVGANATIVCGHRLGEYSFIGAGSVVVSDVSPYALMAGNPARHIGWVCRCGVRLNLHGHHRCRACGACFNITETSCSPCE